MAEPMSQSSWELTKKPEQRKERTPRTKIDEFKGALKQTQSENLGESTTIWVNPELKDLEATANLDDQQPATLYYLGRLTDLPEVIQVYVEELEKGKRKHWAVLRERDYDIMDKIYDIEEDTLDRFPTSDINFRVTVDSKGGPSVSSPATKIYDNS